MKLRVFLAGQCCYGNLIPTCSPMIGRFFDTMIVASTYRGIHADVIVYIFAHLHTALLTEINMLDMN